LSRKKCGEGKPSPHKKNFQKIKKSFKNLLTNKRFCGIILNVRERGRSKSHPIKRKKEDKIMRTMFRAEIETYKDCEGRHTEWTAKGLFETTEDAVKAVCGTTHGYVTSGDYRIVKVTMDEATFTITEDVIIRYDYYDEVTRWEWAKKDLARAEEELAKANKMKPKTETGMAKKEKAVAKWTAEIEKINAKMEGWKREG
jgi:hypothetical protein